MQASGNNQLAPEKPNPRGRAGLPGGRWIVSAFGIITAPNAPTAVRVNARYTLRVNITYSYRYFIFTLTVEPLGALTAVGALGALSPFRDGWRVVIPPGRVLVGRLFVLSLGPPSQSPRYSAAWQEIQSYRANSGECPAPAPMHPAVWHDSPRNPAYRTRLLENAPDSGGRVIKTRFKYRGPSATDSGFVASGDPWRLGNLGGKSGRKNPARRFDSLAVRDEGL